MTFTNELEIHVIALRRSGHHAIINWILQQLDCQACFLNNCRPGRNPFASCSTWDSLLTTVDLPQEAAGTLSHKECLIFNYEDCPLRYLQLETLEANHDAWLGRSRRRLQLLVHRDPFNLFASKLRWARGTKFQPTMESLNFHVQVWKAYAREFLRQTHYVPDAIPVSYNGWVAHKEYRQELAEQLQLAFSDKGVEEVAKWGPATWGDSFDGLDYDGRAQAMKVFERWKHFRDDPFYRQLMQDPELWTLSNEIFGLLPGTETLLEN